MATLTINLPDSALDGLIEAGNRNNTTAEAIAAEALTNQGNSYAELFGLARVTGAAFVLRFTPDEYAAIVNAAPSNPDVAGYITQLAAQAWVPLTDPRLQPALESLAAAGLIAPERVTELVAYDRPVLAQPGE
jgi:hypothetical protein